MHWCFQERWRVASCGYSGEMFQKLLCHSPTPEFEFTFHPLAPVQSDVYHPEAIHFLFPVSIYNHRNHHQRQPRSGAVASVVVMGCRLFVREF